MEINQRFNQVLLPVDPEDAEGPFNVVAAEQRKSECYTCSTS